MSTLDSALELARASVPVFPVILTDDNKKIPAVKDWRNAASTNLDTVRSWFTNTSYVIGVPTGIRSNVDALDIDPRHGGNLELYHDSLPDTRWHETKQGGRHYLFNRFDGMRNSTNKVEQGVDVRGEGGFIVWWPAHGYECSSAPIADWPGWLSQLAMQGLARKHTGQVPLDIRKPPSARHVVDLLTQMENRLETTRDAYVEVMLAAKGCIDALIEAGELDDFDDECAIREAAIEWASRWPACKTDEAAKWDVDWAHRNAPLAGWQTLIRIAADLAPSYKAQLAAEEFSANPTSASQYRGNPNWPNMLIRYEKGTIKPGLQVNANIPLTYAPEWQGVLAYNTFHHRIDVLARPPYEAEFTPRPLEDVDIVKTRAWLEAAGIQANKTIVHDAIQVAAWANKYHPVCSYLDKLAWDGQPRLDTWLIRHLGVQDTPLHRAYSARFMIGAVARVRKPGSKMDTGLVLEGLQGLKKSTVAKVLAGDWFIDWVPDLRTKDAQIQLQGAWVVEFADYGNLGRADTNIAKIFLALVSDPFREPYAKVSKQHPRQCVFIVSLNRPAHGYLKDETGGRRFWPVECGHGWPQHQQIDTEALASDRDQLWAEADHRYKQGEAWWLHELSLRTAQQAAVAARLDLGPWFGPVAQAMHSLVEEGTKEPTFDQIRSRLGLLNLKDVGPQSYMQIGRALTVLGWAGRRPDDHRSSTIYRYEGPMPLVEGTD